MRPSDYDRTGKMIPIGPTDGAGCWPALKRRSNTQQLGTNRWMSFLPQSQTPVGDCISPKLRFVTGEVDTSVGQIPYQRGSQGDRKTKT